jgi:uncharacterized protein
MRYSLFMLIILVLPFGIVHAQEDADAATFAENVVNLLNDGDFDAVVTLYDDTLSDAIDAEQTEMAWESLTNRIGGFEAIEETTVETVEGNQRVTIRAQFNGGLANITITVNSAGEIAGLFFGAAETGRAQQAPPEAPAEATPEPVEEPPYIQPDAFTETEVVVGEGTDFELPGTLALPAGDGPFPVVILLGGSGPTDRDSTVGANTPLRDIAQGLASAGVATLRYDKRPAVYPQAFAGEVFTLQEEYVEDALNAISLVQGYDEIDTEQVYVLGHSLGGEAAPRVATQSDDVAGLILAAPSAVPLHETLLRQVRYLAEIDGEVTEQEQAQLNAIEGFKGQVDALDATLDEETASTYALGVPLGYWVDLRETDPVALTADLEMPVLIVQGARDYQVTVEGDLMRWREGLEDEEDVTINVYDALNHIFMPGEGPGNPQEYQTPGNVAPVVVEDIIAWIASQQ